MTSPRPATGIDALAENYLEIHADLYPSAATKYTGVGTSELEALRP
jgi:hypothetical protein